MQLRELEEQDERSGKEEEAQNEENSCEKSLQADAFNMRWKYQTGKIHKWVLEIQKTYLTKNLGNMGRTSDPIGQTREMDTWATSLG